MSAKAECADIDGAHASALGGAPPRGEAPASDPVPGYPLGEGEADARRLIQGEAEYVPHGWPSNATDNRSVMTKAPPFGRLAHP